MDVRESISTTLAGVEDRLRKLEHPQELFPLLTDYAHLVTLASDGAQIWTEAFQQALLENTCIRIPASSEPYWIDKTVVIPSGRTIFAEDGAVIRQRKDVRVLMFRNAHPVDGTHLQPDQTHPDRDICIIGGRWEESYTQRVGYRGSGRYDETEDFYGVGASFLFNNLENLCLRNMTVVQAAGFAFQLGQVRNALIENITFVGCFGDGVHVGGNSSNLVIRNIRGQVGDDLVAFNAYDWRNSSVTFGPIDCALCETLRPSDDGHYKAMRILSGIYTFDDGAQVDCATNNLIIRDVENIDAFKLYLQTPAYELGTEPEAGGVGSGCNLFFEDMELDLRQPADRLAPYMESDPVRGNFAAFEINSDLKNIHFRNISVKLYKDRFPLSWFAVVGPKSVVRNGCELFDPYFSSETDGVYFRDITINGKPVADLSAYITQVRFADVNADGNSTGAGVVKNILPE